jgi:hypothetical protein
MTLKKYGLSVIAAQLLWVFLHLVNKYYPGYTGHIASEEYLKELKNQLAN